MRYRPPPCPAPHRPPPRCVPQEDNWPLLTVSKGFFETLAAKRDAPGAATGSKGGATAAATAVAALSLDETELDAAGWGDDDLDLAGGAAAGGSEGGEGAGADVQRAVSLFYGCLCLGVHTRTAGASLSTLRDGLRLWEAQLLLCLSLPYHPLGALACSSSVHDLQRLPPLPLLRAFVSVVEYSPATAAA